MKSSIRKYYQEFVDYIDFPTVIYVYETGKILAINEYGKNIIGNETKNINDLWEGKERQKYNRTVLNNGTKILYNKIIETNSEKVEIDMEVNSIVMDKIHLLFCFFEVSQKQYFTKHFEKQFPRIFWKDSSLKSVGSNTYCKMDFNYVQDVNNEDHEDVFQERGIYDILVEEDIEIITNHVNKYHFMQEFRNSVDESFYAEVNRMPIINRIDDCLGIIYVYSLILNQEEKQEIIQDTLKENSILNEIVSRSDTVMVRWRMEANWPVEYISPNISKYGYEVDDFYSKKLTWRDIVHPDDFYKINAEHLIISANMKDENRYNILEYRIITADNSIVWVRDESLEITENTSYEYREGIINDISFDKEIENEVIENKRAFQLRMDKFIHNNKNFDSLNVWNLIELDGLKLLQDSIERVSGIWSFVMDQKGNMLTEISAKDNIKESINNIMKEPIYLEYFEDMSRICFYKKKPITETFLYDGIVVTSMPFILGDTYIGTYFLLGVTKNIREYAEDIKADRLECFLTHRMISQKAYESVVEFLWNYIKSLCNTTFEKIELIEEKKRMKEESLRLERQLQKSKLITQILKLSNLERPYMEVLNNILNKVSSFCDIDRVSIYESTEGNKNHCNRSILYEWNLGTKMQKGRKNRQIVDKMEYILEKLRKEGGFIALYERNNDEEYHELFHNSKVKSAAIAHITLNDFNDTVVLFTNSREDKKWREVDLSLLREIAPIIQNVIVKARSIDIVNRTNDSFTTIMENMYHYFYVISVKNHIILYANNNVIDAHGKEIIGLTYEDYCMKYNFFYEKTDNHMLALRNGSYRYFDRFKQREFLIQVNQIRWFDGNEVYVLGVQDLRKLLENKLK